jgi:TrmH family RNA methyltransferase
MLSSSQLKYLTSLQLKKHRQKYGEFIIEGEKMLHEAISTHQHISIIVALTGQVTQYRNLAPGVELWEAHAKDFQKISSMSTPPEVLAVVKVPEHAETAAFDPGEWILVIDGIRDPGNLGTMLRTADWFGIRRVICSSDCVELYNPKTIQATMGSLFRIDVRYTELVDLLQGAALPTYAAGMKGKSPTQFTQPAPGFLVIGSESHGIRDEVMAYCKEQIHIPGMGGAESLNAAVACGILLWEMCGRHQS